MMNPYNVPMHISLMNAFIIDGLVLLIMLATHCWLRKCDPIRANAVENFLIIIIMLTAQNIVSCFMMSAKSIDRGWWPLAFMITTVIYIFFAVMYSAITYFTCRQISRLYTFIYGLAFFITITIEDILFYWDIVYLPDRTVWFSFCLFLFIHATLCLIKGFRSGLINEKDSYHHKIISGLPAVLIGFSILILVGIIIPAVVFLHELSISENNMRTPAVSFIIYYGILSLIATLPFYFKKYNKVHLIGCSFVLAVIIMSLFNFYMMAFVLFDWWIFCFPFLVFFCIHWFDKLSET